MTEFIDRSGVTRKSGPHVPIGESTDQQWAPPTLACPFLDQGEMSFIQRFVRMEARLDQQEKVGVRVEDGLKELKRAIIAAILTIITGIVLMFANTYYRDVHDAAVAAAIARNTAALAAQAAQGAKK